MSDAGEPAPQTPPTPVTLGPLRKTKTRNESQKSGHRRKKA
jgi:hypothetical protein